MSVDNDPEADWPGTYALELQARRREDVLLIKLMALAVLLSINLVLWTT